MLPIYYAPIVSVSQAPSTECVFSVNVQPVDATLSVDGQAMTSVGPLREFKSPPLLPGNTYTYEMILHWKSSGNSYCWQENFSAGEHKKIDIRMSGGKIYHNGKEVSGLSSSKPTESVQKPASDSSSNDNNNFGLSKAWIENRPKQDRVTVNGFLVNDKTIGSGGTIPDDAGKPHVTIFYSASQKQEAKKVYSELQKLIGAAAKISIVDADDKRNDWITQPFKLDQDREYISSGYKLIVQGPILEDMSAHEIDVTYSATVESAMEAYRKSRPDYDPNPQPPKAPDISPGGENWGGISILGALFLAIVFTGTYKPEKE